MQRAYRFEKTLFSDAHQKLVELLKQARQDAEMTQVQVAEALHCSQAFISRLESGEQKIDVIEFLILAKIYQSDPAQMLKNLDDLAEEFIPKR